MWLNNPVVVPRGQSKKLHRFLKGPYYTVVPRDDWDNCVYKIKQDKCISILCILTALRN